LDELAREGYLVRRRGSGTFVSEPKNAHELTITFLTEDMRRRRMHPGNPKIAQDLTMSSFTEDMRRRGMHPGSKTLGLEVVPAGARLGRFLHVSPSEPIVVAKRLRLADSERMGVRSVAGA